VTAHAVSESRAATAPPRPRPKQRPRRRTGTNACVRQLLREIDVYLGFWAAVRS
jgi:hypothetical protein